MGFARILPFLTMDPVDSNGSTNGMCGTQVARDILGADAPVECQQSPFPSVTRTLHIRLHTSKPPR